MAETTSTTYTNTVADVRALAERLARDATTSRRVDWPALQEDLVIGARFLRSLTRSKEPAETVDVRALADRIATAGAATKRPEWEPLQEDMVAAAQQLNDLTASMQADDAVKLDD